MLAVTLFTVLSQVQPIAPASSVKCTGCTDVATVIGAVVSVPLDLCVLPALGEKGKPTSISLDVARDGTVTKARVTARGSLNAEQSACLQKQLGTAQLEATDGGMRVKMDLQFFQPPVAKEAEPREHRCPAPGHWNPQTRQCVAAPCAGIPGGCPGDEPPVKRAKP